jgi:hypothetical protein
MIQIINLNTSPIQVGEKRWLSILGDEPFNVEIKCFVSNPPPRGFKPCPECGKFEIRQAEALEIMASPAAFQNSQGTLDIQITDAVGDSKLIRLVVLTQLIPIQRTISTPSEESGGSTAMG